MLRALRRPLVELVIPGALAFIVAGLSIADMYLPKPYDGVVLEADSPGRMVVRQVVAGSGADTAGIRPGEIIVGIDRNVVDSTARAAELINRHRIGDRAPYLIRSLAGLREVDVELGRRRIGEPLYLVACGLGFSFFFVGLFVLSRQPRMPVARVFFAMSTLFLLFFVCRLRPASYSWVDSFVLTTGTVALLFLPATFLHFFIIFPREIWKWRNDPAARLTALLARRGVLFPVIYLLPAFVYTGTVTFAHLRDAELALISGAPAANWWVMVVYMLLGLGALAVSSRWLPDQRQRQGAALVFTGTVFGVIPFLLLVVAFPSFLHTERFLYYGVIPLVLVPLTFALAIVRFQLLNIQVILRKSLMYTVTTAVVTAAYALGIASFNWVFRGTELAASPYFPLVFALAIVLLFEPLRQRVQEPINRFFFRERARLQEAMEEMGEAFTVQMDLASVVRELVDRLPGLLDLRFAALFLERKGRLERVAGPSELPAELPAMPLLNDFLKRRGGLVRLDQLGPLEMLSPEVQRLSRSLNSAGVEVIGTLASPRRFIGQVLLSGRTGQMSLEWEDLRLVRGLLQQASIALETSTLLEEKTRQAQLERELKIAAAIQASLLPQRLEVADGWRVAAACQPAREVGGDFYTQLPGNHPGGRALVYGDVSGKSIPGALLMMAAHEVLHALALAHPDPAELFELANRRLHTLRQGSHVLRRGSFVALGYLSCDPGGGRLRYSMAGQPPPLVRRRDGAVEELPLPDHRIPLGALPRGGYSVLETPMNPGDVVVAYSDGVTEAMSPDGRLFGSDRLAEVLAAAPPEPQALVPAILTAIEEFTKGEPAYDDVTLLAVSCCPAEGCLPGKPE